MEKSTTGSNRRGCWSYEQGTAIEQAKVLKARAVPQGLWRKFDQCVEAVGESARRWRRPLTEYCEATLAKQSRKGLTKCLLGFTEVDNERILDVGSLSLGTGTFQVRKPKVPEGCPEGIVRESGTLRAEEVVTSKALVNVDHIEQERWGPPQVDADWYAFCQALLQRYRRRRLGRNVLLVQMSGAVGVE